MKYWIAILVVLSCIFIPASATVLNIYSTNGASPERYVGTPESFSTIMGGAGNDLYDSDQIYTGWETAAGTPNFIDGNRAYWTFNVGGSSIPDGATITGVKVRLVSLTNYREITPLPKWVIGRVKPGSVSTGAQGDYTTANWNRTTALSSWNTQAPDNWEADFNFTMNADGIAYVTQAITGTGDAGYVNLSCLDWWTWTGTFNGTWSANSQTKLGFTTQDYTGTTYDPFIEVTYTVPAIPVAAFSCTPLSGTAPLTSSCTDSSSNTPDDWDWYWGATETKSSDSQNPSLSSLATGQYYVRLYAANGAGGDWENKSTYITSGYSPTSAFSCTPLSGNAPLQTTCTDATTNSPDNWDWYIWANETKVSDSQSPVISGIPSGTYSVRLYTSNVLGWDWENKTNYITSNAPASPPVCSFNVDKYITRIPRQLGVTDTSSNTPTTWDWGWGDGTSNTTTKNATHTYKRPGIYTVWHKAQNGQGSDWCYQRVWIIGWDRVLPPQGGIIPPEELEATCDNGLYETSRQLDPIERVATDIKIMALCEPYV